MKRLKDLEIILYLVTLLSLAALTIIRISPPPIALANSPVYAFSAERALKHLKIIAEEPHPMGTAAHAKVRAYITQQLTELGLEIAAQSTTSAVEVMGQVKSGKIQNIAARLRGSNSEKAVMLAAHYDSVPHSRGASDDGSGVVTLLETARALKNSPPLKNDVIFLFTDAEEEFLLGSSAFVRDHPWKDSIGLVLNFEARGSSGASAMFQTSSNNGFLIRGFAASPRPVGNSLISFLSAVLPNDTDLTMFKKAGIGGMNFAYAKGLNHYHTYQDSLETLDPRSIQHHGSYALALTNYFGEQNIDGTREESAIYFDLFSAMVVVYASPYAWLFGLIAIFVFYASLKKARETKTLGTREIFFGFLTNTFILAFCLVVLFGVSWLFQLAGGRWLAMSYSDLMIAPYLLISFGIFLICCEFGFRKAGFESMFVGGLLLWLIPAIITPLLAPGASYIFQLPLIFSGLAYVLALQFPIAIMLHAVSVVLMTQLIHAVFILDGGGYPALPMLTFMILLGLLIPLQTRLRSSARKKLAVGTIVLGLVSGVMISNNLHFTQKNPELAFILQGEDATTKKAFFFTDQNDNTWVKFFVPNLSTRSTLPAFTSSQYVFLVAEIPFQALPTPRALILKDSTEGDLRTVDLRISSERGARCISLWEENELDMVETLIEDHEPRQLFRLSPELDRKIWALISGQDQKRGWRLRHCALDAEGFKLSLKFSEKDKPSLRIVDESFGTSMPEGISPRPKNLIHDSASDRTLVSTLLQL